MKEHVSSIVTAELDAVNIPWETKEGKHTKVVFYLRGLKHTFTCARSPSDPRAIKNARADIRRTLKQNRYL